LTIIYDLYNINRADNSHLTSKKFFILYYNPWKKFYYMHKNYTFSVVTPVKDEINFFPKTAASMLSQKSLPREWIIVNDGSTDGTTEFIEDLEQKFDWIKAIHLPPDRIRKAGGEFVVQKGVDKICLDGLDFLVRLDGDVQFDEEYFSRLFHRMTIKPKLGVAGGVLYIEDGENLIEEENPSFHVRGGLKTYNINCFKQIGGFGYELGWDTIDEIKAQMNGWETLSFPDLKVIHLKPTRASSNWYKARVIDGLSAYNAAYHPAFLTARAVRHLFKKPFLLGSAAMMWAFFSNYIKGIPRQLDKEYIKFIRKQQLNKILGRETIWK
jgi:poly-beta-1,6-N-acetyl-D-glucosamine synthase